MSHDVLPEIYAALRQVAPEIDPAAIDPGAVLVESLDLDSMDSVNFLEALSDRVGVDIPEADYPKVQTLDQIVRYVTAAPGR